MKIRERRWDPRFLPIRRGDRTSGLRCPRHHALREQLAPRRSPATVIPSPKGIWISVANRLPDPGSVGRHYAQQRRYEVSPPRFSWRIRMAHIHKSCLSTPHSGAKQIKILNYSCSNVQMYRPHGNGPGISSTGLCRGIVERLPCERSAFSMSKQRRPPWSLSNWRSRSARKYRESTAQRCLRGRPHGQQKTWHRR